MCEIKIDTQAVRGVAISNEHVPINRTITATKRPCATCPGSKQSRIKIYRVPDKWGKTFCLTPSARCQVTPTLNPSVLKLRTLHSRYWVLSVRDERFNLVTGGTQTVRPTCFKNLTHVSAALCLSSLALRKEIQKRFPRGRCWVFAFHVHTYKARHASSVRQDAVHSSLPRQWKYKQSEIKSNRRQYFESTP